MGKKAAKLGPPPRVGEVLAIPLVDGQFGACRILGVRRKGRGTNEQDQYVAGTRYVGPTPPDIGHPDLRETVVLTCDDEDDPFAWWVIVPATGGVRLRGHHPAAPRREAATEA